MLLLLCFCCCFYFYLVDAWVEFDLVDGLNWH